LGSTTHRVSAWQVAPQMQWGLLFGGAAKARGHVQANQEQCFSEEVWSWVNVQWFLMASGEGISLI